MRGGVSSASWRAYVIMTLLCLYSALVTSLRRENRCMRHYFVETIRHPNKRCESKNVLLARCEGYCGKSRTNPRVSFSPVLRRPFKQLCTCCRDALSIMKAVPLTCRGERGGDRGERGGERGERAGERGGERGGEVLFATYRYVVRCACHYCSYR